MPKLPHIKNSVVTAELAEPMFKSLYEIQLMPPAGVVIPDHIDEQITSIGGLDTLEAAPDVVTQNYQMGQKRQFSALTVSNIHNLSLSMNLNLHGPDSNDPMILNCFNAWNAKRRNPATGAMGLKKDYIGQMVLSQFNQVGTIWRLVTYRNAFPKTKPTGIDAVDKNSDDIFSCNVTMTSEIADVLTIGASF